MKFFKFSCSLILVRFLNRRTYNVIALSKEEEHCEQMESGLKPNISMHNLISCNVIYCKIIFLGTLLDNFLNRHIIEN
jgi:hypothetical protein